MTTSQEVVLRLLQGAHYDLKNLSATELAELYVDAALLVSMMQFLKEDHWLKSHGSLPPPSYQEFLNEAFKVEMLPLAFLSDFLSLSSLNDFKSISRKAEKIEKLVLAEVKAKNMPGQKEFAIQALQKMSFLFEFENQLQTEKKALGLSLGLSLYRTFDHMDEIFELNYRADHNMKTDLKNTERLYEGAGVGVQSGYSTVLLALDHLQPPPGARFIDLGSGYGRVGLVVGLIRPDIDFIGYEFVPHRVNIASLISQKLGMNQHVHFYTQDLSLKDFHIPVADVYYLYDPFSEETYGHVLGQLIEISRQKKISIITKGNARPWLMDVMKREGWPAPEELDGGNLCLFRS